MFQSKLQLFVFHAFAEESLVQFQGVSDHDPAGEHSKTHVSAVQHDAQTLQTLVQSMNFSDPEAMARAKGVVSVLEAQMSVLKKAVEEENKEDANAILAANSAIQRCNADMSDSFAHPADGVDVFNKKVYNLRKAHAKCRDAEDQALGEWIQKCNLAQKKTDQSIQARPGCLAILLRSTVDKDDYLRCLKLTQTWVDDDVSVVEAANELCNARATSKNNKQAECDKTQADFEAEFCAFSAKLLDVCSMHSTCFSNGVTARQALVASVKKKEISQKEMWLALARMDCLVNLFSVANSANLNAGAAQACVDLDRANTSGLDILYPDADAKQLCDTMPAVWNHSEYVLLNNSNLADLNGCISSSCAHPHIVSDSPQVEDRPLGCKNGMTLQTCSELCGETDCKGFWLYHDGRCCIKKDLGSKGFNTNSSISGQGNSYECSPSRISSPCAQPRIVSSSPQVEDHPIGCKNGTTLQTCTEWCGETECKGFWLYHEGRCCIKKDLGSKGFDSNSSITNQGNSYECQ